MSINLELAEEIIRLGTETESPIIDPSESRILTEAGVASVTAHIEKLSLIDLIRDAQPLFGQNGGMWIGYSRLRKD